MQQFRNNRFSYNFRNKTRIEKYSITTDDEKYVIFFNDNELFRTALIGQREEEVKNQLEMNYILIFVG